MKITTLQSKDSVNHLHRPLVLLLVLLALAFFALTPQARATCQDACLTNNNTAQGDDALINSISGNNTAIGFDALFSNTSGQDNTAIGSQTLLSNTIGSYNTAIGSQTLLSNTTGSQNTATGFWALSSNTTGTWNTANGQLALLQNTTGHLNTAVGNGSLSNNTSGNGNIALGAGAGSTLTTGSNNIDIGNEGIPGESKKIRIGTNRLHDGTYIAGIIGATVPTGVAVIVDRSGHLGTITSSGRFKDAVKPIDKASEAILALKPVTFRYKHDLDPDGIPQFGLVAEDVEKVSSSLVARDEKGRPYTVRYDAVNAMLLNEFLKEHRRNQQQESKIEQQETKIARLEKQIETLTAGLQQLSTHLELSKAAPQTVSSNQ
jgi:hypothetical protein